MRGGIKMSEEKTIQSVSQENRKISPPTEFSEKAYVKSEEEYKKIYEESIKDPESFWSKKAEELHWFKKWDTVFTWDQDKVEYTWFAGGKTNVAYNCLDRHLKKQPNKIKISVSFVIVDQRENTVCVHRPRISQQVRV